MGLLLRIIVLLVAIILMVVSLSLLITSIGLQFKGVALYRWILLGIFILSLGSMIFNNYLMELENQTERRRQYLQLEALRK